MIYTENSILAQVGNVGVCHLVMLCLSVYLFVFLSPIIKERFGDYQEIVSTLSLRYYQL